MPADAAVSLPTDFAPGVSAAFPSSAVTASFTGDGLSWSLTGPDGDTHVATASASSPACPQPTVEKTFVSASDSVVTWKLAPGYNTDLMVWDPSATSCQAFGGASCGGIGVDGSSGSFVGSPAGSQSLVVTQSYEKSGDSCDVSNTASFAMPGDAAPQTVTATYKCSGTPALGWPLFAAGSIGALGVAWWLGRRLHWSR